MTTNDYTVCGPTGHCNKWLESEFESVIATRTILSTHSWATHSWALYHSCDFICILYIISRIMYHIWILKSSVYLQQQILAVWVYVVINHANITHFAKQVSHKQESGWPAAVLQWNTTHHNSLQLYIASLLCPVLKLFQLLERSLPETVCKQIQIN